MPETPLLDRAVTAALTLAGQATAAEFDQHRAQAFERACALSEAALQAAALGAGGADALQQLVDLTGQLAHRLTDLEGRTHV